MADLKAFAEQLVNLTVKEVNELAAILKDEYGIEPAAAAVATNEPLWITWPAESKLPTSVAYGTKDVGEVAGVVDKKDDQGGDYTKGTPTATPPGATPPVGAEAGGEEKGKDDKKAKPAEPAGLTVDFSISAVKKYNDAAFRSNRGEVKSITKNGLEVAKV